MSIVLILSVIFLITSDKIVTLQYELLKNDVNHIVSNSESDYKLISSLGMGNVAFYRDFTKQVLLHNIEKGLTPGTSVVIFDSKSNKMVFSVGNEELGRLITVEQVNKIKTQKTGQYEHDFELVSGKITSTLMSFGVYSPWNWVIISFVDKNHLLKYYNEAMVISIVVAGILFVLIFIIVYNLSNRVSQAIISLEEGAHQLSTNVSNVKIDIPGNDEFTSLASSFNDMAAEIRSTEDKLRQSISDEKRANLSLIDSRKQYYDLIEEMPNIIIRMDVSGKLIFVNKTAAVMFGLSVEECIGKLVFDFIHPDDKTRTKQNLSLWLKNKKGIFLLENRQVNVNGQIFTVAWSIHGERDECDNLIGFAGTGRDITDNKLAEEKLKLAASVFLHSHEGISITDNTATIIDVNDAFTRITGFSREEAIGKNSNFLHSGRHSPEFYADMWKALLKEGYWSGEVWNRRKNGEVYAEMLNISSVEDSSGQVSNYVGLFADITPMKKHQDQLEHIAHYDVLTNLPNRSLLADRLSQAMLHCRRHEQSLAVVFLDLDGFKAVNDAYGHNVGDELLIAISVRMKETLREGDSFARIGGDEFVAVLADLTKVEDCEPLLERLLLAASAPITIGDVVVNVSASIGVTLYPQDNVDPDLLMRHADQAMYMAKDLGKNRYHLFDTAQDDAVKVQRESLEAIRNALDNHEFVLYYQPKVNMRTGVFTGVEALIRWQHPERGLLNPDEFLPVIESNPMSIEIGEWVIDTALTQISQWQTIGVELPVTTSVNVAALQLQQPDFTDRLTTLLAAHPGVDPSYLELEVLETSALEDVQHTSIMMYACMALGVKFALDDFGTGYSSLTYLRRLPANLIKIDQSFVRDMLSDADDLAIVEGVIALAKSFNREVIAEGVETIEHGTALLQLGCELAQGYGIAKPMPASDIPVWIRDWKPDENW